MYASNMSNLDRFIRLFFAVVLIILSFTIVGTIGKVAFSVIASILILTTAIGFCPAYDYFNLRTNK